MRLALLLWYSAMPKLDSAIRINVICRVVWKLKSPGNSTLKENFRSDSPKQSSPRRNSAKKTLCGTSFHPGTQIGFIHWESGLWGTGTEFGSATSHIFFSKDVMDEPACAAVEITFRPCLRTGRWMIWRWKRYRVGRNIQQPQNKLSACPRQFNRSTL